MKWLATTFLLALALWGRPAPAQVPAADAALYQAATIVTGTDMRSRPEGFARCLRTVLVKASGEPRLLHDPRLDGLAAHPEALVAGYDYVDRMAGKPLHDEQGSSDRPYILTVHFDPVPVNALLAELGLRPWRGKRPTIIPVLRIHGVTGTYLLSADAPGVADPRTSLADKARELGLGLQIPTSEMFAAWKANTSVPRPLYRPRRDEVLVAGALDFRDDLPGWTGALRLTWHGRTYRWTVTAPSYDAAFRAIMHGALRVAADRGGPE